jgi:FAD-dependent halogenase
MRSTEDANNSPTSSRRYEFVVIGGGPAGSTVATILAEKGHSVLVLEAAKFPRFAVGELIAATSFWHVWNRLGITQEALDQHFVRKYGGIFQSPNGMKFEFDQNVYPDDASCHPFVYNLERAKYDLMLMNGARKKGAEIVEQAFVEEVRQDSTNRVNGLRYRCNDEVREVSCDFVIDASGRANVLARQLGLRLEMSEMKSFSVFAHYEGGTRMLGRDEGNLRVMFDDNIWAWWAPLKAPKSTVGLVANRDVFWDEYVAGPEQFFEKHIQRFSYCMERLDGAKRITSFQPVSQAGVGSTAAIGYHYETKELVGEGWALVGDAGGFVDPIFAAGLFAAQSSAIWLADELHEASREGDLSKTRMTRYQQKFSDEFGPLLKHVKLFAMDYFDPRFVDFFVSTGLSRPQIGRLYIDTFIANDKQAIEKYASLMKRFLAGLKSESKHPMKRAA